MAMTASDKIVRVLLVEDNPGDARLFKEAIKEAHASAFELTHCESFDQVLAYLARNSPDVIVLDLGLPDVGGVEAVQKVRVSAPSVPLVVLTGLDDEALAVQALHKGAQDYLIKGQLNTDLLIRALRYAIERHRTQTALQNQSLIDELTGLANRRGFLLLAEQHVALARRVNESFMVVFVDLDGLKQINDTLGHQQGDQAIIETANVLRGCSRQCDILARLGGDEFALLLPSTADDTDELIRRRFQQAIESCNAQPHRRYTLSFSAGIVVAAGEQLLSIEELMAQADALMYVDKRNKKAALELGDRSA